MEQLVSSLIPVPSVKDFAQTCLKVISEIYTRFKMVKENEVFQKCIKEKIEDMQKAVEHLETSGAVEFPQFCAERLQKFFESLEKCRQKCEELHNKGALKKIFTAHASKSELQYMEKHLEIANSHLHYTLSAVLLEQTKKLQNTVDEGFAQTITTVNEGNTQISRGLIHPEVGIYQGASQSSALPLAVAAPILSEDRKTKLMIIKWNDCTNLKYKIIRYEVQYEAGVIVHGTPKSLSTNGSDTKFTLKLSHPRVIEKQSYTIQVRAVNLHGPGPWSEASTIRFLSDRPSKPKMPHLKKISPTEVAVEIDLLTENEANGSPVHSCAVEYRQVTVNKPSWKRINMSLRLMNRNSEKVEMIVRSLRPDTRYNFRIIMINEIGESQPSNENEILTNQLIPGIPQNFRISSKRTDKTIKIRWEPPLENPQVVQRYHAQIR